MRRVIFGAAALVAALAVAGCGNSRSDRALSGAGIGAGIGAAGAVITGGDLLTGAVVGGAVGAATGAVTDDDDVAVNRRDRKKRKKNR
ncbi:MAG: hypothetical protein AAF192_11740 [Pseudomonadota bacterium]